MDITVKYVQCDFYAFVTAVCFQDEFGSKIYPPTHDIIGPNFEHVRKEIDNEIEAFKERIEKYSPIEIVVVSIGKDLEDSIVQLKNCTFFARIAMFAPDKKVDLLNAYSTKEEVLQHIYNRKNK